MSDWHTREKKVEVVQLKKYDLKPGDRVKYVYNYSDGRATSPHEQEKFNRWRVIKEYDRVFVCKNCAGYTRAFTKKEYRLGEVIKLD